MVRIRNGKVLARKLSISEGWYLFAEVFSRNLQFGITWKYESRLFGCRKRCLHIVRWNYKRQPIQNRKGKCNLWSETMLLRGKIFSQISWEISYLWIKFIKSWIRNLSTTVFFFDSSYKFFHSIHCVTYLTEA